MMNGQPVGLSIFLGILSPFLLCLLACLVYFFGLLALKQMTGREDHPIWQILAVGGVVALVLSFLSDRLSNG